MVYPRNSYEYLYHFSPQLRSPSSLGVATVGNRCLCPLGCTLSHKIVPCCSLAVYITYHCSTFRPWQTLQASGMNGFGKGGGIYLMDDSIETNANDRVVHNSGLRRYKMSGCAHKMIAKPPASRLECLDQSIPAVRTISCAG